MVEHFKGGIASTSARSRLLRTIASLGSLALLMLFGSRSAMAVDADGLCNIVFENCYENGFFTPEYETDKGAFRGFVSGFGRGFRDLTQTGIDVFFHDTGNPLTDPLSYDGAYVQETVDVTLPSTAAEDDLQYRFSRYYDSRVSDLATVLGHGWTHNYDEFIPAPSGPLPGATSLPETSWFCAQSGAYFVYPEAVSTCVGNPDPIPAAPAGPVTDRIDNSNGDAFLVRGAVSQRFHRIGPAENGVTRFQPYPDSGVRLEYHLGDGSAPEARLIKPASGITRVYRPLYAPSDVVLPLPPGAGGWVLNNFWRDKVAPSAPVLLGYYLAEIRNDHGERMAFEWEVARVANELVARHGLPRGLGRLRKVIDTTGRQIYYHYRDLTRTSTYGTAFPELWCVSLSSNRNTCKPTNAATLPALVSFDFGNRDPNQDLPTQMFPPPTPRSVSTLTLLRVLDAQGQTVQRYTYDTGYHSQPLASYTNGVPTGPVNDVRTVIPTEERGLVCDQLCGESAPNDPVYGTVTSWSSNVRTDVCAISPGAVVPADTAFRFGADGGQSRADCEAVLQGGQACIVYAKAVDAIELESDGQSEANYCANLRNRYALYDRCEVAVSSNYYCGGSISGAPLETVGNRWVCDSQGQNCSLSVGSHDRNVCKAQCIAAHAAGYPESQPLYGYAPRLNYNLIGVYNSLDKLEVENTYESSINSFEFDRVTSQTVNKDPGATPELESAVIDIQYFDLKRPGATGSAQVKTRVAYVDDDTYSCSSSDANGCITWVKNGPGSQRPTMATRTTSVHGQVTVAYLDERGALLRVDTFSNGDDTTPYETVSIGYDSKGRVVNELFASGERMLREYASVGIGPDVISAVRSETRLASARFSAPAENRIRTAYSYSNDGKLQDARSYAGTTLVSWTHLTRDAQQRIASYEIRYSAAANAPSYGVSYRYSPKVEIELGAYAYPGVVEADARWYRDANGATYVMDIAQRRNYAPEMAAYADTDSYDAKGRLANGSDFTTVVAADVLLGSQSIAFDSANALVASSTIPSRRRVANVYNAARRPVTTVTSVWKMPSDASPQNHFSNINYCKTGVSNSCGVLPQETVETWTDPLTNQARNRVTSLTYDAMNQVVATRVGASLNSLGSATCRHVAWDGRVLDVVNAEGEWTSYEYDAAGRRIATEQGYNNEVPVWAKPCEAKILANAGKVQWEELERTEFHPGGFIKARIVAGMRTEFTVDGFGRVIGEVDPAGRQTRRGYDAQGRVIWEATYRSGLASAPATQPSPSATGLLSLVEMAYDDSGRITEGKSWDLDKQQALVTTTTYDDKLRYTITKAPNGVNIHNQVDAAGRSIYAVSSGNVDHSETTTIYDWAANTVQAYGYDNHGDINVSTYLDGNGRVREVYDGTTRISTQTNDVFGRAVRRTARGFGQQTFAYDVQGSVTTQTQAAGSDGGPSTIRVDFGYDEVGRRTQVSQWGSVSADGVPQDQSRTDYAYDALGRTIKVTEPVNPADGTAPPPRTQETTYLTRTVTVAGAPRLQATTSVSTLKTFGNSTASFLYDGIGRLKSELFRPGLGANVLQVQTTREWTYDDCPLADGACGYGRVIRGKVSHDRWNGYTGPVPQTVTTENRYDSRGRLTESWNDAGTAHVVHTYDLLGTMATTQLGGVGNVLTHHFEELGRISTVDLKIGTGDPKRLVAYDYGYGLGVAGRAGSALEATYGDDSTDVWSYDALRRPSRLIVGGKLANGSTDTLAIRRDIYGENGIALMREHSFKVGGALQTTADAFAIDEAGRLTAERTGIINANAPAWPTSELAASQLATMVTPLLKRESVPTASQFGPNWRQYQLDGRGNWKTRETQAGQPGQYRTWQATVTANTLNAYTGFTLRDLATSTSTPFTLSRSAEDDTTVAPSYTPGAAAGAGIEFTYDLFDHPITLTNRFNATSASTASAVYDAFGHRVLETNGTVRHYLWSGDEIVAWGDDQPLGAPDASQYSLRVIGSQPDSTVALITQNGTNKYYFHQWVDGSTLAITNGSLLDGARYSAWGEVTWATGTWNFLGVGPSWLWKGALYDARTGTYSMRAREFSPQWGRFLSTDPLGQDGGLNVYAFGMGRSDLRDPSGLEASTPASGSGGGPGSMLITGPKLSCPVCNGDFSTPMAALDPNAPAQPPAGSDDNLDDILGPATAADRAVIEDSLAPSYGPKTLDQVAAELETEVTVAGAIAGVDDYTYFTNDVVRQGLLAQALVEGAKTVRSSGHFGVGEFAQHARPSLGPEFASPVEYPKEWEGSRLQPLIEVLEAIREATGKPVTVESGYRSADYNKAVYETDHPGKKVRTDSRHIHGDAADIKVSGYTGAELRALVYLLIAEKKISVGGLGWYPRIAPEGRGDISTSIHIDLRPGRAQYADPVTWKGL